MDAIGVFMGAAASATNQELRFAFKAFKIGYWVMKTGINPSPGHQRKGLEDTICAETMYEELSVSEVQRKAHQDNIYATNLYRALCNQVFQVSLSRLDMC